LSAFGPSEVEVSVDGAPIYRSSVGPGTNRYRQRLLVWGISRTVRVTVTDANWPAGRSIDQPYLFTDSVLTAGLHEFSYFAGVRSQFDASTTRSSIGSQAWQAFHRYGATNDLTHAGRW
jgi:outer membrane usher protein FimD/PapC